MKGNEVYKVIQPKPDRDTLGFGIHGDAAPTHKTDGLFTISWNSVHGTGSTMETRYIYAVVKKSDLTDGTLEVYWERLAWAMNALADGKIPPMDWKGKKHPQPVVEAGRHDTGSGRLGILHLGVQVPQVGRRGGDVLGVQGWDISR